jgi:hypothetical protein
MRRVRSARYCGDERALLKRAFGKFVLPHVDEGKLRAAIAGVRFGWRARSRARRKATTSRRWGIKLWGGLG